MCAECDVLLTVLPADLRAAAARFTAAADAAKVGSRKRTKYDGVAIGLEVAAEEIERAGRPRLPHGQSTGALRSE
jgi:hypothetical protein